MVTLSKDHQFFRCDHGGMTVFVKTEILMNEIIWEGKYELRMKAADTETGAG